MAGANTREAAIQEADDLINEIRVKERSIARLQKKIEENRKRLVVLEHFIYKGELP